MLPVIEQGIQRCSSCALWPSSDLTSESHIVMVSDYGWSLVISDMFPSCARVYGAHNDCPIPVLPDDRGLGATSSLGVDSFQPRLGVIERHIPS